MTHMLGAVSRAMIAVVTSQPRLSIGLGGLAAVGFTGVFAHLARSPF